MKKIKKYYSFMTPKLVKVGICCCSLENTKAVEDALLNSINFLFVREKKGARGHPTMVDTRILYYHIRIEIDAEEARGRLVQADFIAWPL
jgi:hypothetical protein